SDSDSDSDEEAAAQMRQFLEAADHTLLNNAMFQQQQQQPATTKHVSSALPATGSAPHEVPAKSERFLDEQQSAGGSDLQITEHMQTHIWKKLRAIIESQTEFVEPKAQPMPAEEEIPAIPNNVPLLLGANCFIQFDSLEEKLPTKKPKIKRRQVEDAGPITDASLAAVAVSGASILQGQDVQHWAQRAPKKHKLFEYKSCDSEGHKLRAVQPTNEFSTLRRKNQWNESKICKKPTKINKK
ncbi:hypothetical protein KR044_005840, partial [Drosophila immigrans]